MIDCRRLVALDCHVQSSVGYSAFKLALDVCCLIGNYPVAVFVRDELVSCLRAFSDSAVLLCAS